MVTNLNRMEAAVKSDLSVEVARTMRRLSSYILAESNNIFNALDDVLFCIRMSKDQLNQRRVETPQAYGGVEVEELLLEAEADLDAAIQVLQSNYKFSPNFKKNFSFARTLINGESIHRLDPAFTIAGFDEIWHTAFDINLRKEGSVIEFTTGASDLCMSQIQPKNVSDVDQEFSGRSLYCPVDEPCWLMTTRPSTHAYYLTHQLLFLLLGQNGGCAPDFEAQVRRYFGTLLEADAASVTPELMRRQCRAVLDDAKRIAKLGYPDIAKDLFTEQGFLCGAAVNMPEFFSPDWIRTIISWQLPSGCYGFEHPSGIGIDFRSMVEEKSFDNLSESEADSDESSSVEDITRVDRPGAAARREQVMSDSCYAHFTAVTLGYFAVAMRYLAE
ncbi:Protein of unknown function DUF4735 [Trinorchestia longiramus]|nr:Protein of unknown function DUF4735 [Trinorchestia longiramus]